MIALGLIVAKLVLLLTHPLGVSVDQAQIFGPWGFSEMDILILGWVLQSLIIFVVWIKKGSWAALVLAANPWINVLAMFHILELISLISVIGLYGARKKWIKIGAAIILLISIVVNKSVWLKISQNNLVVRLNPARLAQETNETQKINFMATGKTYLLPGWFRKVVYNKAALAIQTIATRTVGVFDFEQWDAPLAAWVITGLSGLPPKGITTLFYFWEIPLMIFGLLSVSRAEWIKCRWWIAGSIILAIFFEKRFFTTSGIGLLPVAATLITKGIIKLSHKLQYAILVLYIIAAVYFGHQLFFDQFSYRYSDAYLYREMANWLKQNQDEYQKAVVTNKFGPTDMMLQFYGVFDSKITVREFKLSHETTEAGTVYIGLPKEFDGVAPEKIVTKIAADDELVHEYGKGVWVASF